MHPRLRREEVKRIAASAGLVVARPIKHVGNGFLLVGACAASYDILARAETLEENEQVVYADPNLLFPLEPDA